MPLALAESLFQAGKRHGSTLTIDATDEKRGKVVFKGLTILGTSPTNSPHEAQLVLVDRRWVLKYVHLHRRFNVPKRTGNVRKIGNQGPATQKIIDDVAFAPYSLKDGRKRWTTDEIIEEVMNSLFGAGKWVNRSVLGRADLPDIEDLTLEGDGDTVLGLSLIHI
jgi:hypothetical protein